MDRNIQPSYFRKSLFFFSVSVVFLVLNQDSYYVLPRTPAGTRTIRPIAWRSRRGGARHCKYLKEISKFALSSFHTLSRPSDRWESMWNEETIDDKRSPIIDVQLAGNLLLVFVTDLIDFIANNHSIWAFSYRLQTYNKKKTNMSPRRAGPAEHKIQYDQEAFYPKYGYPSLVSTDNCSARTWNCSCGGCYSTATKSWSLS